MVPKDKSVIKNQIGFAEIAPNPLPTEEQIKENQTSTFDTFISRVAHDNNVVSTVTRLGGNLITELELEGQERDPNFNPLEQKYLDITDPDDLPFLVTSRNENEYYRRLIRRQSDRFHRARADNGTFTGNIAGGIYNTVVSFTDWAPFAGAIKKPTVLKNALTGLAYGSASMAASSILDEALLQATQEDRSMEESINNSISSSVMGGLFGGMGGAVKGGRLKALKSMVDSALDGSEIKFSVGKDNKIDGLNIYQGGSAGAMLAKKVDLVDESLVGWGRNGELQVAKPIIWAAGTLFQNPVVKGLTSKSPTIARFTNDMYEHNMDIVKSAIKGEYKGQSLQTRLEKYNVMSVKADSDIINSYMSYLGLPDDKPIGNLAKSIFKNKEGLLKFDDYLLETSLAITRGGKSKIPQISSVAAKIYKDIYEPQSKALEKLGYLAPNISPFGASQYLNRVYDKEYIKANTPKVKKFLMQEFQRTQVKIMRATRNLDDLKNTRAQLHYDHVSYPKQLKESGSLEALAKKTAEIDKKIKKETKRLEQRIRKGLYSPDMLLGEAGMSHEQLKTLKQLRKPLNKIKREIAQKTEEINVHKRKLTPDRKPGQKNNPADAELIKLQKELDSLTESLKKERGAISEKTKLKKIDEALVFKGRDDNFYLRKSNKGTLKFRPIEEWDRIDQNATNTINNILGQSDEDIGNQILGSMRGGSSGTNPLAPRNLLVKDWRLYKNKLLVSDPRMNIKAYTNRTGKLIEMDTYLKNKGWDGKSNRVDFLVDGIRKDYDLLNDKLDSKYARMKEGVTNDPKLKQIDIKEQKARLKLSKDLQSDINLCEDTYRRIAGAYDMSNGSKGVIKASRFFANWGYATQLGALVLTALQDAVAHSYRGGPKSLINEGVLPFVKNSLKMKGADNLKFKTQCADLNLGLELETALRQQRFHSNNDYDLPMTFVERQMSRAASAMGIVNLSAGWSDMCNRVAGTAATSRIIRDLKSFTDGTLSKGYEKQLAVLGLNDKDIAKKVTTLYDEFGEELSGGYLANWQNWDKTTKMSTSDAIEIRELLQGAIRQEVYSTIFKGKNIASFPSGVNPNGLMNGFMMYMGYMFNASSNYTIPLLQRFDKNKVMGTAAMIAMATLNEPLRQMAIGEEPDLDPWTLFGKGVLNSGVGGMALDVLNKANTISQAFPSLITDKNKRMQGFENSISLLGGMPGTVVNTALKLGGMTLTGEYNKADYKALSRLIPLAWAIEFRGALNSGIDSLDLPETRAKARKAKD